MAENRWLDHLERLAVAAPDSPSVESSQGITTRREFFDMVTHLCEFLGSTEPARVSIVAEQADYTYAAIFACVCTETNYNPIPANTPVPKIDMYLQEFQPDIVLCDQVGFAMLGQVEKKWKVLHLKDLETWLEDFEGQLGGLRRVDEPIAYTMFTSGSTGRPKGVQVTRAGVRDFLSWLLKAIPTGSEMKVSQFASIGFDLSFAEIMFSILSGGCLVPFSDGSSRAFPMRFIARRRISHLFCVPSLVQLMMREDGANHNLHGGLSNLSFCLTLGEPLLASQARFLFRVAPAVHLINTYGPTEATVLCSEFVISSATLIDDFADEEVLPIGRPIGSNNFEISDPDERGVGELIISGPQVALGYLDAEQSARSFIYDRHGHATGYRSGDLVRVGTDGVFSFHGRADRQVKVSGTRVELGEIEAVVRSNLSGESAVIIGDGKPICFSDDPRVLTDEFRVKLMGKVRDSIGATLSPVAYLFLSEIPKSSSGKIDYRALNQLFLERDSP